MGYCRTFSSAVVFGSKFSGGLGFTNVTAAQTGAKICNAIQHVRAGTKTGQKFLIMVRWAQLSASTGTPILEETRHLKYLEGKWHSTLLTDMQHIDCKIQLHDPRIPTLQYENDTFKELGNIQLVQNLHKGIVCVRHQQPQWKPPSTRVL
eukprot:1565621-Ditylum_brightwellii.AAC.1